MRLGEADKIVTLLTEHHGKVRAVAKGVRKTKSRFGGRLEPLSHVAAMFYERRQAAMGDGSGQLDIVTQVEVLETFRPVREDLDRLDKANTVLEATDQVAQERHSNARLYQMLLGALRALSAHDSPMLVPAYLVKLLSTEGVQPVLDTCVSCGKDQALVAFDIDEGGVLCRACARSGAVPVSAEARALLRRVLEGDLAGALNHPSGPVCDEVGHLANRAMEHHLERRLRSLHLLNP